MVVKMVTSMLYYNVAYNVNKYLIKHHNLVIAANIALIILIHKNVKQIVKIKFKQ